MILTCLIPDLAVVMIESESRLWLLCLHKVELDNCCEIELSGMLSLIPDITRSDILHRILID
jgi:hypothetical protein